MTALIVAPFEFFTDNQGAALEAGYIYVGTTNLDPKSDPVAVFWDKALSISAAQPIRTIAGRPSYNGSPGNIYVDASNYSITIENKNNELVSTLLETAGSELTESAEDASSVVPNNRLVSGASRTASEQPYFLSIDGGTPNVTILGNATNLKYVVNGTDVLLSADLLEEGLIVASAGSNTCLVDDDSLTDQLSSKYVGEEETTLTIGTVGSGITSKVGQTIALQKDGGTEIMLAYVKSVTELTNIKRGWFYDENEDPLVRETLADGDQLNILSLGWVFLENDAETVDVSYTTPVYSYTEPVSPVAGDYWFSMSAGVWMRYTSVWTQINRILVGTVAVGTVNAEGVRSGDYFFDYRDTNTMDLEVFSDEIIQTKDKTNDIFAYSATLRIDNHKTVWDNTLDMETGVVAGSTKYYLYIAATGQRIISLERYHEREDLRGKYHPYEAWRYVGEGVTDNTSDWALAEGVEVSDIEDRIEMLDQKDVLAESPGVSEYRNGAIYKFDQWGDVDTLVTSVNAKPVPYKNGGRGALSNVYTGYETVVRRGTSGQGFCHKPSIGMGLTWWKNMDATTGMLVADLIRGSEYWLATSSAQQNYDITYLQQYLEAAGLFGSSSHVNTFNDDYVSWNWAYTMAKAWVPAADLPKKVMTPLGVVDAVASGDTELVSGGVILELYNPLTHNGVLLLVGTGTARAIDHSAGAALGFQMVKGLDIATNPAVYHSSLNSESSPADYYLNINTVTAQQDNDTFWDDTPPTDSLLYLGTNNEVNASGNLMVIYYSADVEGLQDHGYYTGSGSVTLRTIETKCKDGFFIAKLITGGSGNWVAYDSSRGDNVNLLLNSTAVEGSIAAGFNEEEGFDISSLDGDINASGAVYAYIHFGKEMSIQGYLSAYPTTAKVLDTPLDTVEILIKYNGAAVLNTELLVYASREATPNWQLGSLTQEASFTDAAGVSWQLLKATIDLSGNAQDVNLRWRVVTMEDEDAEEETEETEHNFEYIKIDAR